jgi:hypothetical protein
LNAGAKFWRELKAWGEARKLLSPTESGVLEIASQLPSKLPTEKQSAVALAALTKLQQEGCQLEV